jgi:hypothetical protein
MKTNNDYDEEIKRLYGPGACNITTIARYLKLELEFVQRRAVVLGLVFED